MILTMTLQTTTMPQLSTKLFFSLQKELFKHDMTIILFRFIITMLCGIENIPKNIPIYFPHFDLM